MASCKVAAPAGAANPARFNAALDEVTCLQLQLPLSRLLYWTALQQLLDTPAPDIGALAAKMELVDPLNLDHHFLLLGDVRRLAGAR